MVLLVAAASLALVACGDDDETSSDDTSSTVEDTTSSNADDGGGEAQEGSITITEFAFDDVTAAAGETIAIANETGAPHTVTADDDEFDSGQVAANSEGEVTAPDEAGSYEFHCEVHPSMTGTLTVT
jgi:plastocyanin